MPKYRSQFEKSIAQRLSICRCSFEYETLTLPYTATCEYTPDFILENGIAVEAKGYLRPSDRKKLLLVRSQHPGTDLRIIFQNPAQSLSKRPRASSYGQWATDNGFTWAQGSVPVSWTKEPKRTK